MALTADAYIDSLGDQLCRAARSFAARGLCPAAGGNFSARIDGQRILMSASGVDKSRLSVSQLMQLDLDGTPLTNGTPSVEAALHVALYRRDARIGAVLHAHSAANTVLSRVGTPDHIAVSGYELQKTIGQRRDATGTLALPVIDNSPDVAALAAAIERRFDDAAATHGFLVRGHGIYVWGVNIDRARRHLEGWEFLLDCELKRRLLEAS